MELQNPAAQLNLPNSPPPTPNSARFRRSPNDNYYAILSANRRKRHGIAQFDFSPPEHIAPRGGGHQFSYSPPDRDEASVSESEGGDEDEGDESSVNADSSDGDDDESGSDDSSDSNNNDEGARSRQQSEISEERRPSIVRSLNEETDFTLEDLSDDNIGYDDLEVSRPYQIEEARSDLASKASDRDIIDRLKDLNCGREEEIERARQFEFAQREAYRRRQKRWSLGGYKKRSHTQSVGSQSSGHEDIEPLEDIHLPGASARRLRRRTQGPEDSELPNRTSLMFENPPEEIEELAVEDGLVPPLLDSDGDLWSDDDDDGIEEIDLILPHWLMELESNPPSRPSTSVSIRSAYLDTTAPV